MSAAVSFTGVSRSFGRTRALADVSFQVPENSVCALLGPNGAGKTTAIRALLGLARTDAGEISVLGERPGTWRRAPASDTSRTSPPSPPG